MLLDVFSLIQESIRTKGVVTTTGAYDTLVKPLIEVALDFPQKPKDYELSFQDKPLNSKVILMSGGMDSLVMWELNKDVDSKLALFVDLGQPYTYKEWKALKDLKIPVESVEAVIPQEDGWNHIVPGRNLLLLGLAEQYVEHEGEIWIGAVEGESPPDKGDKSQLFFRMVEELIWRTKNKKVTIKTLQNHTKNDWLYWYLTGTGRTDILNTVTCFNGDLIGCGSCQACVRKAIALRFCGVDTQGYFNQNPFLGGASFVDAYKAKFSECLKTGDFSHYSERRCKQDLQVILDEGF